MNIKGNIGIKEVQPGSVKITIELTPEQAEELLRAIEAGQFEHHGVVAAELRELSDEAGQFEHHGVVAAELRELSHGLIGSDKVEGTAVYDAKGEKIGSIERVMIEKRSGQVAYAVLQFGGFLGIGTDYYPIPWASLSYDTSLGGYRTTITEQGLRGAPKYAGDSWDWEDRERGRKVYEYYGEPWRGY